MQLFRILVLSVVCLGFSSTIFAEDQADGLSAQTFVSSQGYHMDWLTKRSRKAGTAVFHKRTLYEGEPWLYVMAVSGMTPDTDGNVKLSYYYTRFWPEGREEPFGKTGTYTSKAYGESAIIPIVGGIYETKDPKGSYKHKLYLTDEVSGKTTTAISTFELLEWETPQPMPDAETASQLWDNKFYNRSNPQMLYSAFMSPQTPVYIKGPTGDYEPHYIWWTFFKYAFKRQPFVWRKILDAYPNSIEPVRTRIEQMATLLSQVEKLDSLSKKSLGDMTEILRNARVMSIPPSYERLDDPRFLMPLIGEFLADGSFQPIKRMTEALNFKKDVEFFYSLDAEARKNLTPEEQASMRRAMTLANAENLLTELCKKHELAKFYVAAIMDEQLASGEQPNIYLAKVLKATWPEAYPFNIPTQSQ